MLSPPAPAPELTLPDATAPRHDTRSRWSALPATIVAASGFAVWMCWSVITVQMLASGYAFTISELFSLIATAGIAGGTLRLALGFITLTGGSRYLLLACALLLMFPLLGITALLQREASLEWHAPLWQWQLLALLTGLGGGVFSACLAQVATRCPPNRRGLILGIVTGVGHLGITLTQVLLPLVVGVALWPTLAGSPRSLAHDSGTLLGSTPGGSLIWMQNGSLLLIGVMLLACSSIYRDRHDAAAGTAHHCFSTGRALGIVLSALAIAVFGLWLTLPGNSYGLGLELSKELVLVLLVAITLMLVKTTLVPERPDFVISDSILNNKHAWIVGLLGVASLGSLLGFAAAFPLLLQFVFGYHHQEVNGVVQQVVNSNSPSALTYAWMGPLTGILARPLGSLAAGRLGGARVMHLCMLVMTSACAGAAYILVQAYAAPDPASFFLPFLLLFMLLFAAAGAAHAAVLHTVIRVFPSAQATWVHVWLSALAGFGVFYIPQVLGEQLAAGTPQRAMVDFACFYAVCLLLNGWFYLRKQSIFHQPTA